VSESGKLEHRPGGARSQDPTLDQEPYVPSSARGVVGEWSRKDPMRAVRAERESAGAQVQRSLKAWRKQSEAGGAGAAGVNLAPAGGASLPADTRKKMEPRLGADLSSVKVHTGTDAASAAEGLGARAFTVGGDVHFGSGQYQPGTKEGDRLLAHELTHVVQGQRSGIQRKADGGAAGAEAAGPEVSHPDEPAEKEADGVADHVTDQLHGGGEHAAKGGEGGEHGPVAEHGAHAAHGAGAKAAGGPSGQAPAQKPAAISAKFIGVGRKIHRAGNGKAPAASPAATGAAPAAAGSAAAGPAAAGAAPAAAKTPADTLKEEPYKQFQARFAAMLASLQMPADPAACQDIWLKMVTTLMATDAAYKAAPEVPGTPRKDLSSDAFKNIMKQFEPISAALGPYMEKFTKGKKTWAFWSGKPAMEVAKKNADVCLEKGALGSLFDGINIMGNWDMQMWASLSKAYATHAAKAAEHGAQYRGFVGAGSGNEQSIFNQIEQPQFLGMLDQKQAASLKITWYACAYDPKDMGKADASCNAGGMEGVIGTSSDRSSMVALAESMNGKRAKLFKETGKVVAPADVDAALAAAQAKKDAHDPKSAAAGGAAGAPAAPPTKPEANKAATPAPGATAAPASSAGAAAPAHKPDHGGKA
jgi:hypothetical protein